MTLTKHVTKYKYMQKWMVEFFSKSQSRVIKIARVNSIRMTHSIMQGMSQPPPSHYAAILYETAYQIRLKIALPSLHSKNKLKALSIPILAFF